jgi:hypothetical protein
MATCSHYLFSLKLIPSENAIAAATFVQYHYFSFPVFSATRTKLATVIYPIQAGNPFFLIICSLIYISILHIEPKTTVFKILADRTLGIIIYHFSWLV